MASPRDVRRLAFQALFQFDARGPSDEADVWQSLESVDDFTSKERRAAFDLAKAAFADRKKADTVMVELAPTWPVHRQAAVDRAILRLAHYEMTSGKAPPKVVVNEAVELAKAFSTKKSPAFINGLLDKVLKRVLASNPAASGGDDAPPASDAPPESSLAPETPSEGDR
ncbi:MAG: transcription antitermination factor NusB [Phycisphaerales bacterium]|nr:transcription antitermination factor NusB [Phycisphaerales bacterium]